jgi:hypothetical protein
MNKGIFFIFVGVAIIVLKLNRLIEIEDYWIIGCFALGIISTYVYIHNKNKERNTPKPVYLVKN